MMKLNSILLTCVAVLLLNSLVVVSIMMRTKVQIRRNTFFNCESDKECDECVQEDSFKKCERVCYCCTAFNQCYYQKINKDNISNET
mmetsp:Transcript_36794/g.38167  ORF Transcript_36794/g.38167 Transcript_36794/m.38167 type:complete len:87 (+) Transcript_36794:50-310(+)